MTIREKLDLIDRMNRENERRLIEAGLKHSSK